MKRHNIRKARLLELIAEAGGQRKLADRTGVKAAYISQLVNDTPLPSGNPRNVGDDVVRRLESGMNKPEGWMDEPPATHPQDPHLIGEPPPAFNVKPLRDQLRPIRTWQSEQDLPDDQYVLIPSLTLELAAGNGKKVVTVDQKAPKAFLSAWIHERRLRPQHLVSMKAVGDSMAPWVNDGDAVLVDLSDREIRNGKPYAIRYGDELRIKNVHRRFDGGLLLQSVNRDFADEIIAPADLEHVEIIGLVVWRAG